jgi:hypothetical protein
MNGREALQKTLSLVESSGESSYASEGVERIGEELRAAIAALDSRREVDRANLKLLFAPTGAIQELSLANGWGDEFLPLASAVDAFLASPIG